MTFTDIFSELWSSLSLTEAHAEAPPADDDSDDKGEEAGEEEEKSGDGEGEDGGDDAGDDDGGEEDEEEEEEDEEEPEDIKPKLEEGTLISILSLPGERTSKCQWLLFGLSCSLEISSPSSKSDQCPSSTYQIGLDHNLQNKSSILGGFRADEIFQSIECAKSSQCAPLKHHYDACAERVTKQQEDEDYKGPKEDCVEECRFHHSPITLLHQLVYGPRNPPLRAQGSNVIFIVATPLTQKLCSLPPITLCHPMRSSQVIPLAEMTVDQ